MPRTAAPRLTHLDERGQMRMVDVSEKPATLRRAVARGSLRVSAATLTLVRSGTTPKGDVLAAAPVLARIHELASEPGGEPPEAFAQRIRTELALWQEIARIAGIVPE